MRDRWAAPSRCWVLDSADRRACAEEGRGRRRIYRALLRADRQTVENARITFPAQILSAEECNGIEEKIGAVTEGRSLIVSAGKFAPKPPRAAGRSCAEVRVRGEERARDAALQHGGLHDRRVHTYYRFDNQRGSFAAELIPAETDLQRRRFVMGEENIKDAVACRSQEIELPKAVTGSSTCWWPLADKECEALKVGDSEQAVYVPLWKGFYGQWGWRGHSEANVPQGCDDRAYRHAPPSGRRGQPALRLPTCMVSLDIPEGARTVTLPENKNVAVFAMTRFRTSTASTCFR